MFHSFRIPQRLYESVISSKKGIRIVDLDLNLVHYTTHNPHIQESTDFAIYLIYLFADIIIIP